MKDVVPTCTELVCPQFPGDDLAHATELATTREHEEGRNLKASSAPNAQREEKLIHELFEEQVTFQPEVVAVQSQSQALTYLELNRRANQLARYVQSIGVGSDRLVALFFERSPDMVLGMLGALKAGGAYVPLDPSNPRERLEHMLSDAKPRVILTHEALKHALPETNAQVIAIDGDWERIATHSVENLDSGRSGPASYQLAYVIYTSGSTGKAKGVMIEHRNIVNYSLYARQRFDVASGDGSLVSTSFSFDLALTGLFPTLISGRTVRLCSEQQGLPDLTRELLACRNLSPLKLTPSHLGLMEHALRNGQLAGRVRALVLGGEPLQGAVVQMWKRYCPGSQIFNHYGPTETTVGCVVNEIHEAGPGPIPIGRPIENTHIYILDFQLKQVAVGDVGEIYIGGSGVARGYLNRPELTAERFVADPFGEVGRGRMYRSGDLGRWRADGTVECLGRIDQQVKIRGHRVELGEIESQLMRHPQVREAVVLAREDVPGDKRLAAYLVSERAYSSDLNLDRVRREVVAKWQSMHEQMYHNNPVIGPSHVGWNRSYTGETISEIEMRGAVTCVVDRILSFRPQRMLEIGCGGGLLLQQLAPRCETYVGTDLSASALSQLRQWTTNHEDLKHVTLLHRSATELQDLQAGSFDTVVLNSVIQYFPDIEYLLAVLKDAVRLLGPGGRIFLGGVRNLRLLSLFHTTLQLNKTGDNATVEQLRKHVERSMTQDKELVLDPKFFELLPGNVPGIRSASVQLKRGRELNELNCHRYDVVLEVGEEPGPRVSCSVLQWGSVAELDEALSERRWTAARFMSIPNLRVAKEAAAAELIRNSPDSMEATELRLQLASRSVVGIDPETLWELADRHNYDISIHPGECDRFEIELIDRTRASEVSRVLPPTDGAPKPWRAYANDPLHSILGQQLIPVAREYLKERLPEYMVPAAWMVLEQLPLTQNGKVDRKALPSPQGRPEELGPYIAPRTVVERTVADVWGRLLRIDQVGALDNFFELGGHSLLVVRMMEQLREEGLHANVRTVYDSLTLADLAIALESGTVETFDVPPNLIPSDCHALKPEMLTLLELNEHQIEVVERAVPGGARNIQDVYPLTPLQEGILFHHLLGEGVGDAYVVSTLLQLSSPETVAKLVAALQTVIDRHDVFRTSLLWEQLPAPVQIVSREARLLVNELTMDNDRDPIEQMRERMNPTNQRWNLHQAPLIRLQVAEDVHSKHWYAVIQCHHLACDLESTETVLSEIVALIEGRSAELPEPVPYRNHVAHVLAHARVNNSEEFFRSKLGDIEEPTAPFGLLDVYRDGRETAHARGALEASLAQRIRAQARRLGVSTAALFHVAWALVVSRTSGLEDVVFGTVLLGRLQGTGETRRTVGLVMNTLPLRLCVRNVTTSELVKRAHRELVELLSHEQASLAEAQRCTAMSGSTPLFTALLNYRHLSSDLASRFSGQAGVTLLEEGEMANYPLILSVDDLGEGFVLVADTDRRIDPRRIVGFMQTVIQSLASALESAPESPPLSLRVLPESESQLVIEEFNQTQRSYPRDKVVHELFEEQARRAPDAVALECDGQSLTYSELNRKSNQLARHLATKGVGPDQLVALYVERGPELIVGMLGVLKAGGAYVPLDTSYPVERLQYMLRDSSPAAVVTEHHLRTCLPKTNAAIVAVDDDWKDISSQSEASIPAERLGLSARHLAYVIYTSGSTGAPKGVMVEHRQLSNLVHWHCAAFDLRAGSRCSSVAAVGFDAAAWEIWPALSVGATLLLPAANATRNVETLLAWWVRQRMDVSFLPTPIAEFALSRNIHNESLRTLLIGGDRLRHAGPALRIAPVNNYGPTESTVVATSGLIQDDDTTLHIGRPISNAQIYILDARCQSVLAGTTGEIYISGASVARGYLGRPGLTAQRFLADPFSADSRARMYRTGDLGRWRTDGTIEFLGRNDNQIKIRGIRVELGEIEAQIIQHEQVKDAVVIAREDGGGGNRLVAYVVPDDSRAAPSVESIRTRLKALVPEYMVPSAVVILDSLPLTPNGKLDRRALPVPSFEAHSRKCYQAPEGEAERTLAEIWRGLLEIDRIGREDSFFELGGHSLLVLRFLSEANRTLGCSLKVTDVYRNPTIRELASRVSGSQTSDEPIVLAQEAKLEQEILEVPALGARVPPDAILLTGATGFVGRFLLVQLLQDTAATIYCLVRASSRHHASARIRTTLSQWDLWRDDFEPRIVAVPGDLRLANLGMEEATYERLRWQLDCIYHCGTSMNHLETYAMAKAANVESARELLRLATTGRRKLINYVSTLSVFNPGTSGSPRAVEESTPIDDETHRNSQGYIASKWVAEKMFETADARAVPCNIFRIGLVWADAQQGRFDEFQNVYRVLKSALMSGYGIQNHRYLMVPTPVDYVARATVSLADRHSGGGGKFHITSSEQAVGGIFERCNEIAGTSLELLPQYQWIQEIKRLHDQGWSLPAVPLIEYAFSLDEASFHEHERRKRADGLRFDCAKTHHQLESAGVAAPVFDDELLRKCVERMLTKDVELRKLWDMSAASSRARKRRGVSGA